MSFNSGYFLPPIWQRITIMHQRHLQNVRAP